METMLRQLDPWSLADIAIIWAIIYQLLLLIRGTRAMQMGLGILILLGVAFLFGQVYPLTTFKWLMERFYSSILIILVILFQDDIRRVLSRVGKKPLLAGTGNLSSRQILDEIIRAATALGQKKIGALIVFERNIILSRYVDVGILLDARVSKELIVSVFHPSSPIHDGAIVIQQGRIAAAECFLPLTRDEDVDPNFGTRHRAAIGISQETDAIVVAVSEESSVISLVADGVVRRGLEPKVLRRQLQILLGEANAEDARPPVSNSGWSLIERLRSLVGRGRL